MRPGDLKARVPWGKCGLLACRRPACAHTHPAHQALARSWHTNSGVGWCREAGRGSGGGEDVTVAGTQSCSTGAISLQLRGHHKDGLAGGNSEGGSWQAAAQRSPTHIHTHSHTHHLPTLTRKHMHSHSHTDTHTGTLTPTHTVTHSLSHTHTRVCARTLTHGLLSKSTSGSPQLWPTGASQVV